MASKFVELENRTRSKFRFPRETRVGKQLVTDREIGGTLVIGDSADANIPAAARTVQCPSPIVVLPIEQYQALGKRNLATIDALVARGDLRKTERTAP